MKLAIASDHRGKDIKDVLTQGLKRAGIEIVDFSPENNSEDDYPDFAFLVGNSIKNKQCDLGILICGTGIGMSIAANKIKGISCARVLSVEDAKLCREHNGANVIALSSDIDAKTTALIVKTFISTKPLTEERFRRRAGKTIKIELGEYN